MRRTLSFVILIFLAAAVPVEAASGRVIKVLPHFLDLKGLHTVSPSLYERDAYQAYLRQHPEKRSGVRVDVQWKAREENEKPLTLRIELRGSVQTNLPNMKVFEKEVPPGFWSRWTSFTITGEDYRELGEITAWRATLWDGDWPLDEQKSFLW